MLPMIQFFFFFNNTATTEIYTLSLHDALPISLPILNGGNSAVVVSNDNGLTWTVDRKSTRLNSSHANISYAVFCLKKKKNMIRPGARTSTTKLKTATTTRQDPIASAVLPCYNP